MMQTDYTFHNKVFQIYLEIQLTYDILDFGNNFTEKTYVFGI